MPALEAGLAVLCDVAVEHGFLEFSCAANARSPRSVDDGGRGPQLVEIRLGVRQGDRMRAGDRDAIVVDVWRFGNAWHQNIVFDDDVFAPRIFDARVLGKGRVCRRIDGHVVFRVSDRVGGWRSRIRGTVNIRRALFARKVVENSILRRLAFSRDIFIFILEHGGSRHGLTGGASTVCAALGTY